MEAEINERAQLGAGDSGSRHKRARQHCKFFYTYVILSVETEGSLSVCSIETEILHFVQNDN